MRILFAILILVISVGCSERPPAKPPKSDSGVSKVSAKVGVGSDGMTTEQRQVKRRVEEDNKPGAIKHLYVISAMSGQVIVYSTVKGKVTSSGKRLTPIKITAFGRGQGYRYGDLIPANIGGRQYYTNEVLQDDGTYGSSIHYLYWWDTQGRYHQHYVSGGQIIHVSDQPLLVKGIIINMELTDKPKKPKKRK